MSKVNNINDITHLKINDHMKMVFNELQKEEFKTPRTRDYFYIKLLQEELGFEVACILRDKERQFHSNYKRPR